MLENILIIVGIAVAAAIIGVCIFRGNKSVVMRMLYAAVTEAEKDFGGGTGSLKLASVIAAIYPKLPVIIKLFISEKIITRWVEQALTAAKEVWAKNARIADYIGEEQTEQAEVEFDPAAEYEITDQTETDASIEAPETTE